MFPQCKSRSMFSLYYSATGLIGEREIFNAIAICVCVRACVRVCVLQAHASPCLISSSQWCTDRKVSSKIRPAYRRQGTPFPAGFAARYCLFLSVSVSRPMAWFPVIMTRWSFLRPVCCIPQSEEAGAGKSSGRPNTELVIVGKRLRSAGTRK